MASTRFRRSSLSLASALKAASSALPACGDGCRASPRRASVRRSSWAAWGARRRPMSASKGAASMTTPPGRRDSISLTSLAWAGSASFLNAALLVFCTSGQEGASPSARAPAPRGARTTSNNRTGMTPRRTGTSWSRESVRARAQRPGFGASAGGSSTRASRTMNRGPSISSAALPTILRTWARSKIAMPPPLAWATRFASSVRALTP